MSAVSYDAALVVARLEAAGAALLALPQAGHSTRLRTQSFDIVRDVSESYGWTRQRLRPPPPDAAAITRMDEAMGWLTRLPHDAHVLRRIVGARALVSPLNGKHLYSWRQLGLLIEADHKAVQRWHADGIARIVASLNGSRPIVPTGQVRGGAAAGTKLILPHDQR